MILFLKNLAFTLLLPGMFGVYLPWAWARPAGGALPNGWGVWQVAALIPLTLGASLYLACVWQFAHFGRGTPAPIDAPKRLVVYGPYRFVRNPMYIAVTLVVLGWALLFESWWLVRYAALVVGMFHLFVLLVEEPMLRHKFGDEYASYVRAVRRWLPGRAYPARS